MNLFKRNKTKVEPSKSKVLDEEKLIVGNNIEKEKIEEIVKTTDSMRFVASSFSDVDKSDTAKLAEASRALMRSYELAVRKISSTYEEIIETKKVVSNDFLTVQIMIKHFERNFDISTISNIINVFSGVVEKQLAFGKTVKLDEKLILEPAIYVNKMIPIANYSSDRYTNVNVISWDEITRLLNEASVISSVDVETIGFLIKAVLTNVDNGYYVKFGNIVIARVKMSSPELMVLFSNDTILRLNKIYTEERMKNNQKVITKANYLSGFEDSLIKINDEENILISNITKNEKNGKLKTKEKNQKILNKEKEFKELVEKNILDSKNKDLSKDVKKELIKSVVSKTQELKLTENPKPIAKVVKKPTVKKTTTKKTTTKKTATKKPTVKKTTTKK